MGGQQQVVIPVKVPSVEIMCGSHAMRLQAMVPLQSNASRKASVCLPLRHKSSAPVRIVYERIIVSSILNLLRAFSE